MHRRPRELRKRLLILPFKVGSIFVDPKVVVQLYQYPEIRDTSCKASWTWFGTSSKACKMLSQLSFFIRLSLRQALKVNVQRVI